MRKERNEALQILAHSHSSFSSIPTFKLKRKEKKEVDMFTESLYTFLNPPLFATGKEDR